MRYSNKKIPSVELLGNNLKAIRKKQNKSIRDFAKYIQYDRNCLGYVEDGLHDMKLETVLHIAEILNKDVSALFDRSFKDDESLWEKDFKQDDYITIFSENASRIFSRQHKGRKQFNYAESGVERETISRLINGQVQTANVKTLDAVATILDVPVSKLLTKDYKEE